MEENKKILILEDNPDTFKMMAKELQTSHYKVIPACREGDNDYSEFSDSIGKMYEGTIFDYVKDVILNNYNTLRAIVCDLQIGVDNNKGAELIQEIRTKIKIKQFSLFTEFIPIIIYTNFGNDPIIKPALANGATAYIDKHMDKDASCLKSLVDYHSTKFAKLCEEVILKKTFIVGLTFCGKDTRSFVHDVAQILAMQFSTQKVFFDEFHESEIVGLKSDQVLDGIYTEKCEYVVLFMSKNYQKNHWTGGVEWGAIQTKVLPTRKDSLIPVLCDDKAKINDIDFKRDILIKVNQTYPNKNLTAKEVADRIIKIIIDK